MGPPVRLEQPFAPPSQRLLQLTPEVAVIADRDAESACLLTFGLPGARAGPRAYAAYFRFAPRGGDQLISGRGGGARGFLIQEVGELRGKSAFTSGTLRFTPRDWMHPAAALKLNASAADGTSLGGRVQLTFEEGTLRSFERRYAGDIAALQSPASQPTTQEALPSETTPPETPARGKRGDRSEF